MRRRVLTITLALLAPLLLARGAWAQTSAVTATVTDPDSTPWVTGAYTIQLVSASTGIAIPAGQAFRKDTGATITNTFTGTLDGTGSLSLTLTSISNITPAGATWRFTICPAVSGSTCAVTSIAVNASGSLSSQLSAVTTAPRIAGGPGTFAYADVEVAATAGNTYYNTTTPACRYYTSSWGACGGGGGSGTVSSGTLGEQAVYSASGTTVGASGLLLDASQFAGGSVAAKINAAIAACSNNVVVVPATMGAGAWTTTIPSGCQLWDYRQGTVNIYTPNIANSIGLASGLGVNVNYACGTSNPIANNSVAIYSSICSSTTNIPVWGSNFVSGVANAGADAPAYGSELDINNNAVELADPSGDAGPNIKEGLRIATGGSLRSTDGWSIHGQRFIGGYFDFAGTTSWLTGGSAAGNPSALTTQAITGSGTAQAVTVSGNSLYNLTYCRLVDGASTEDVYITADTGSTITGVFANTHASGKYCQQYGAQTGFDLSNAMFQSKTPIIAGSMYLAAGFNITTYGLLSAYNAENVLKSPIQINSSDALILNSLSTTGAIIANPGTLGLQINGSSSVIGDTNQSVSLTGKTAAITSTALISSGNVPSAGQYVVNWYIDSTVVCATPGPAVTALTISFTDEIGARTQTTGNIALGATGATNQNGGSIVLWTAASTAINYSTSYTACTSGTGTYAIRLAASRVQ